MSQPATSQPFPQQPFPTQPPATPPVASRPVPPSATSRALDAARPSAAFVGAAWLALLTGSGGFLIGLWNARMSMSEKGFYLTVLLFGLFAAVSLQKSVRDALEGVTVSAIYHGLCWLGAVAAVVLLTVGLWNADLARSEKGFYAMAFTLAVFAAITVQKNVRDLAAADAARPAGAPATAPAGEPARPGQVTARAE